MFSLFLLVFSSGLLLFAILGFSFLYMSICSCVVFIKTYDTTIVKLLFCCFPTGHIQKNQSPTPCFSHISLPNRPKNKITGITCFLPNSSANTMPVYLFLLFYFFMHFLIPQAPHPCLPSPAYDRSLEPPDTLH